MVTIEEIRSAYWKEIRNRLTGSPDWFICNGISSEPGADCGPVLVRRFADGEVRRVDGLAAHGIVPDWLRVELVDNCEFLQIESE